DALARGSMFNVLSLVDGEKVDFWMLTDDPFDQSRFGRRQEQELLGIRLKVSTPEDTILVKLRWAALQGGSEKQFTDARQMYEAQRSGLDPAYLSNWAGRLGVTDLWQRLQAEAQPL